MSDETPKAKAFNPWGIVLFGLMVVAAAVAYLLGETALAGTLLTTALAGGFVPRLKELR